MEFLSNIEQYYTNPQNIVGNKIIINDEESKHITRVMRHKEGDEIYVTNGEGKIFLSQIVNINRENIELIVKQKKDYTNAKSNYYFCIPKLKSTERFEYALEKCTELGITNFIVFESERTVSKGSKIERWNKILLSAMKQSLQAFLPKLRVISSIKDINNLEGIKVIFEQDAENNFNHFHPIIDTNYYFIFGPEGGLSESEISSFENSYAYKIASNRLRSETAIVKCAALL